MCKILQKLVLAIPSLGLYTQCNIFLSYSIFEYNIGAKKILSVAIYFRLVSLKGSDFDTKRSLLEALRRGFPGGSVSFWPGIKNEHVNGYWHWLVGQYDPAEGVKLYGTSHLGQHEDNYWVLSEEVHNYSALEISS